MGFDDAGLAAAMEESWVRRQIEFFERRQRPPDSLGCYKPPIVEGRCQFIGGKWVLIV